MAATRDFDYNNVCGDQQLHTNIYATTGSCRLCLLSLTEKKCISNNSFLSFPFILLLLLFFDFDFCRRIDPFRVNFIAHCGLSLHWFKGLTAFDVLLPHTPELSCFRCSQHSHPPQRRNGTCTVQPSWLYQHSKNRNPKTTTTMKVNPSGRLRRCVDLQAIVDDGFSFR